MGTISIQLFQYTTQKHSDPFGHVHGELLIDIDGKTIPQLGYSGREDVCLNGWFGVLRDVIYDFTSGKSTEYTYNEGEEGQPIYKFELKKPGEVTFSVDSIKRWRNKTFPLAQLEKEFKKVTDQFLKEVAANAPSKLNHWKSIINPLPRPKNKF